MWELYIYVWNMKLLNVLFYCCTLHVFVVVYSIVYSIVKCAMGSSTHNTLMYGEINGFTKMATENNKKIKK